MTTTSVSKIMIYIRNLLIYKPPSTSPAFELEEIEPQQNDEPGNIAKSAEELHTLLRLAHRVETSVQQAQDTQRTDPTPDKVKAIQKENSSLQEQTKEVAPIQLATATAKIS
jgi:hypothetical protein